MQLIPVIATPSQTLSIVLGGQAVQVSLYSLETPGDILAPLPPAPAPGPGPVALITVDSSVITIDESLGIDQTGNAAAPLVAVAGAGSGPTMDSGSVTIDSGLTTIDQGTVYSDTALPGTPALYMDLTVNGQQVLNAKLAQNLIPMLLAAGYYDVAGDFVFVDTNALAAPLTGNNPDYTGLGDQYQLVYLEATDLVQ